MERLPKMADGVAVDPCATMWAIRSDVSEGEFDEPVGISHSLVSEYGCGGIWQYEDCYSTREAAKEKTKHE